MKISVSLEEGRCDLVLLPENESEQAQLGGVLAEKSELKWAVSFESEEAKARGLVEAVHIRLAPAEGVLIA